MAQAISSARRSGGLQATRTQLQQKLALYRDIFAHSADGIAIIDPQGYYVEQNVAHETLTGYSDQDLQGATPAIHLGEECFRRIGQALAAEGSFRGEVISRRKDGTLRTLDLSAFSVLADDGSPLFFVGIKRDITARIAANREREARVRELEALYKLTGALSGAHDLPEIYQEALTAVFASLPVDRASILIYDDDNVMRFKAWRGLSDAYRQAVEGHSPWSREQRNPAPITVPDVNEDAAMAAYLPVFTAEGIRALGFIPICYEGELLGKFMLYCNAPHQFAEQEVRTAEAIAAAVAVAIHRQLAEQALRRAERLATAGRLAATISHEVNNPLEAVTNLLFLSMQSGQLPEPVRSYIETASQEVQRIGDITRQTLGFYRHTQERVDFDVSAVLHEVLDLFTRRAHQRGVQMERHCEAGLRVHAMTGELRQVFVNLVGNALDAMPAGGTLTVSARRHGNTLEFRFRDTGAGIPAEQQSKLFQPFFTTKQDVGTGLGLWITREIVQRHGGKIEFSSTPQQGSTFTVRLPAIA